MLALLAAQPAISVGLAAAPSEALGGNPGFGDVLQRAVEGQMAPVPGAPALGAAALPGIAMPNAAKPDGAIPQALAGLPGEVVVAEPEAVPPPFPVAADEAGPDAPDDRADVKAEEAAPSQLAWPAIAPAGWTPPPPTQPSAFSQAIGPVADAPCDARPQHAMAAEAARIDHGAATPAKATLPEPAPPAPAVASSAADPVVPIPAAASAAPPALAPALAPAFAPASEPAPWRPDAAPAASISPAPAAALPPQATPPPAAKAEQAGVAVAAHSDAPAGTSVRSHASAERLVRGTATRIEPGPGFAPAATAPIETPEPASPPVIIPPATARPHARLADEAQPPAPAAAAPPVGLPLEAPPGQPVIASPTREAARVAPASPTRQVLPMAIAMLISPGVTPTLSVTLDPAELGRLEIRVGRDAGRTSLRLIAEKPETMALLARDRGELQQGLTESGIVLNGDGIRFEMAGAAGSDQQAQQGAGQQGQPQRRRSPAQDAPSGLPQPAGTPQSLLDMRV